MLPSNKAGRYEDLPSPSTGSTPPSSTVTVPTPSLVRARDREDSKEIEQRAGIDTAISYTRAGCYAYRIAMTRGTWSAYLAAAREAIDRDNFKDAVARKHSE